jgi:hypothetical protein
MSGKTIRIILWVTVFAIAMAFLETAVVIYLRKLYYPEGFEFPLKIIDQDVAITEFIREIATLIMLAGIGFFAGRNNIERFAFFIFSFAIWDIFYYVFLYLLLGWPASLFTWDVLFLVPVTWVGPVLAPVINSITMILLAAVIIYWIEINRACRIGLSAWLLLVAGSLVVITAYVQDYWTFMTERFTTLQMFSSSSSKEAIAFACSYTPRGFNWWFFLAGVTIHIIAILIIWIKIYRTPVKQQVLSKY